MINVINVQQPNFKGHISTKTIEKAGQTVSAPIRQITNAYPISFHAMQVQTHSKGSSPQVARQLKALDGTLDEKLLKAKDIILKDMDLPSDLVECVDRDLGGAGYAAFMATKGKIVFDKKYCQKPDSEFSDEAVMCILRHELDHMEVFTKLYKVLGKDEFEKLIKSSPAVQIFPPEMQEINFDFYEKMSKHVDIKDFDAQKYIDAWKNYSSAPETNSHYKNFNLITKNFDNALEDSAREKQYELEDLMGVTTLKDFYSMIDETKVLTDKIKAKGITDEEQINTTFDELFDQAVKETGLEDKTSNWGKILKHAEQLI